MPSGGIALNGPKIRHIRENSGQTVRGFAKTIGISFTFLSQIERGDRRASAPTAKLIADGLGVDMEELRDA